MLFVFYGFDQPKLAYGASSRQRCRRLPDRGSRKQTSSGHNRSRKEGYNHDAYRISRRVTYEHATSYYSSSHCCQSHHRCISSWRKINGKDRSACTVVLPDHHAFSRHLGHGASFIDKTWQKRWSDWYSCKAKTVPKLGLLFRFDQVRFKHIHCLFAKFGKML